MNTKEIFKLLIIVGITLIAWIGYEAYIASTKSTLPEFKVEKSLEIDPNLDVETLKNLSSKIYYQQVQ